MRVLIVTDAPWLLTSNAIQALELAKRLQADMHTIFWMPVRGFSDGGKTEHEEITVLPGDDEYGNRIISWHCATENIDLVITRGSAKDFTNYGGSYFRWLAWHPGDVERRTLRKAIRVVATTQAEHDVLVKRGLTPDIISRGIAQTFNAQADGKSFRAAANIPDDGFLLSAIGQGDAHMLRLLDVFAAFQAQHDDAYLYVHTNPDEPLNLGEYCKNLNIPQSSLRFPSPYLYHLGAEQSLIADMYKASNVHCVPGESVLPVLEAQACGTPVLASDRPELAEAMEMRDLGAKVPPITMVDGSPLLDIDGWVKELNGAYAMTREQRGNHSDICQMVVCELKWKILYANAWKPLLDMLQDEERKRFTRTQLEGTKPDRDARRSTAFLEDLGHVEKYGFEVIRKTDTGGNEQDEREQNAIVMAAGSHPNITPILEEGTDEFGRYWFDTEKLQPLEEIADFTPEAGDKILHGVAAGLERLHAAGIAHRDIGPKNVLVRPDGTPVIFDFDWILGGLTPELARACDYTPTVEGVIELAVPVMKSGISTRGFHRVVMHVRNMEDSAATSKPDLPYQQIDGIGERDCDARWEELQPDVKGKRVLDLGCNLGYWAARALKEGASTVHGIDRDSSILANAVRLHPELQGKLETLNLNDNIPTGEYDVVFCLSIWQHLKSGRPTLLEYLKTVPNVYWEDANLTKADLRSHGFHVTRLGSSNDKGRRLFKLEVKEAVPA
jgi:glycosyltransferase involved in cell wall biosynthesis